MRMHTLDDLLNSMVTTVVVRFSDTLELVTSRVLVI